MVSMTTDERSDYLSMVDRVIARFWDVYQPYFTEFEQVEFFLPNGDKAYKYKRRIELLKDKFIECGKDVVFHNLYEKLSMLETRYVGAGLFQYGFLYLAATKDSAAGYARRSFAGGELGLIAYRMIEGMDVLQLSEWKPDGSVQDDIARILEFSQEDKSDPIVITLDGIDSNNLLSENGGDPSSFFDFYNRFGYVPDYKFRYIGELNLSAFPTEHLKKV